MTRGNKARRLGYGGFVASDRHAQTIARNAFLQAIQDHAPDVVEELHGDPQQLFFAAQLDHKSFFAIYEVWERLACGAHKLLDRRAVTFYNSLLTWTEKHNITISWFVERAFFTVHSWSGGQTGQAINYGGDSYVASPYPQPPSGVELYDPIWQTREDYLNALIADAMRRMKSDPLLSLAHETRRRGLANSITLSKPIIDYCKAVERRVELDGGSKLTLCWIIVNILNGQCNFKC